MRGRAGLRAGRARRTRRGRPRARRPRAAPEACSPAQGEPHRGDRSEGPAAPSFRRSSITRLSDAAARSHHQESPASTAACATVSAAAIRETSTQKASGYTRISVSVSANRHESPSKNISWKRVKKLSNPSTITGTASSGDRERGEAADQQAARHDRRAVATAQSATASTASAMTTTSCTRRAVPKTLRTSRMCESSRSSNAGEPSGSRSSSRSSIPLEPGWIDSSPRTASSSAGRR